MDTSYLSQQVTTIIERLHGFFDEIGVPSHERDSRESELFSALSETLHNQLNQVAKEKHELTEEAKRLIKTIRQMERSLDDTRPDDEFENDRDGLRITLPLIPCIQSLKEKHRVVSKLHRERYEEVKKLVEALQSYASHLEPSFVTLKLPPTSPDAKLPVNFDLSPTYVGKLDKEFTRIYEEYRRRVAAVSQIAGEIISLWSELGTPQAQVDSNIVQYAQEAPEQLGLHQEDLKRLQLRREKLVREKQQRETRLKELRANVGSLWDRLGVEEAERKQFLAANRGCGLRQINEFEDQLAHLNELKRQNLHLFVEDARYKLQELWDGLYFSEEEMLEFTPAFSDVYSDALLSAHEKEIARLEALKGQRAPILAAIDKHRSLIKDREDLEKSSHDASRLMAKGAKGEKRDPGKLLREEKLRKRIAKELPKIEVDLRKNLESWEDEYGRPFLVHGERYLDELEMMQARAPPPRSKTPNALSTARDPPKSAGRPQTQSRPGTMREAPPPRSKTPTATIGRAAHLKVSMNVANVPSQAATATSPSKSSPSKIPGASRLPMSTMRDGQNSPERRARPQQAQHVLGKSSIDLAETIRPSRTAPPLAPPPKMKDLFVPPTPTPAGRDDNKLDLERSSSIVRHVQPDDPYDDKAAHRFATYQNMDHSAMGPPPRPLHPRSQHSQESSWSSSRGPSPSERSGQDYPVAPPSRQASNTSSIMSGSHAGSTVAGSENWETYTDNSETEEADATEAYYAKVKAQRVRQQAQPTALKRPGTAGGLRGDPKRSRDHCGYTNDEGAMVMEGGDAAWTDDLGDTF